jgi:hypothetical protein
VTGALPEVDDFADRWERLTGVERRLRMSQGVYALHEVRPPGDVNGEMRFATDSDRPLLADWVRAFTAEATPGESPQLDVDEIIDRRLSSGSGGFARWTDAGETVSISGFGGETPTGVRIGPVYTPPALRRRGYASALVAELSARLLDGAATTASSTPISRTRPRTASTRTSATSAFATPPSTSSRARQDRKRPAEV